MSSEQHNIGLHINVEFELIFNSPSTANIASISDESLLLFIISTDELINVNEPIIHF